MLKQGIQVSEVIREALGERFIGSCLQRALATSRRERERETGYERKMIDGRTDGEKYVRERHESDGQTGLKAEHLYIQSRQEGCVGDSRRLLHVKK